MLRAVALILSLVSSVAAFAVSATWSEWKSGLIPQQPIRVLRFIRSGDQGDLVVLSGGRAAGLLNGVHLRIYRQAPVSAGSASEPGGDRTVWVTTGSVKAVEVQDDVAIAKVEADGSELARAIFPRFPGIMAGDFAVEKQVSIARNQMAAPTVSVTYGEIFADPKRLPSTFELRAEGYDVLRRVAGEFERMRLSTLMIEGYTDQHGAADQNQVESYQRAMTVRQFLIDELGFDEKRVVAIGYGEGEPADPSLVPGYQQANRRIVFKAITQPGR